MKVQRWRYVGVFRDHAAGEREEWIDEFYDQCARYDTTFFFKQWGTWGKDNKRRSKKANGRTYRGQTWDDMPRGTSLTETIQGPNAAWGDMEKRYSWKDGVKLRSAP
jgi:hypothetical protein